MDFNCVDDCGGGGSWECAGEANEVIAPVRASFTFGIEFRDTFTDVALPGVHVRACKRLGWSDVGCALGQDAEATTDDSGQAKMQIPFPILGVREPWDGYLLVTRDDLKPEIRYGNIPSSGDVMMLVKSLTGQEFDSLMLRYGLETTGHGSITVLVFDCIDLPGHGAALEIEPRAPETRRYYSLGQLVFSETATETGEDGFAIFGNVPEGIVHVHVRASASGATIADVEVPVRAGTRTVVVVEPWSAP